MFEHEWQLNLAERIYVVLDPQSYNICPGGKGGFGYVNKSGLNNKGHENVKQKLIDYNQNKIPTEKELVSRQKASERMKELHQSGSVRYDTFVGKTHSEESRRKISEGNKGKQAWNKDGTHTEETRLKLSVSHKKRGTRPPCNKGVPYWNNGVKNTLSVICPGLEWTRGRIKKIMGSGSLVPG